MKNSILTLAAILTLFTSCTKEDDFTPVSVPCTSTEGIIIETSTKTLGNTYSYQFISELYVATDCDTTRHLVTHAIAEVDFAHNLPVITFTVGDSFTVTRY